MKKSMGIIIGVLATMFLAPGASGSIRVALVRSWNNMSIGAEAVLNDLESNWSTYGSIEIDADTSLMNVDHFTYEDLLVTHADVLWLSDPAGHTDQYSDDEIAAIEKYASRGHHLIGSFLVFQHASIDNRQLADLFGLRSDIGYISDMTNGVLYDNSADPSFDLIQDHRLFNKIANPFVNYGYTKAQLPQDDLTWDQQDLNGADILAVTPDNRGIITWYQTDDYYAVYVSEMFEYHANNEAQQFFYNAFIIPEPSAILLLGLGGLAIKIHKK